MSQNNKKFIERWAKSEAAEQKNKDLFLTELCDVLGVDHPDAAGTVGARDDFVFEKDVRIPDEIVGLLTQDLAERCPATTLQQTGRT